MLAHRLRRWPNIKPALGQRQCLLVGSANFQIHIPTAVTAPFCSEQLLLYRLCMAVQ